VLEPAGFVCQRLPFSEADTPEVDNLFARIGEGEPHLCFAGHTDVVPPGEAVWTHPPFAAEVHDGWLYGRGAADMKGGVACFAAAALQWLAENDGAPPGSISFLITCDEEGPAINGTAKVLDWMDLAEHLPNHCLLGEPTCENELGDAVKIGRRGSLNGALTVLGKAGHVAYQHLANNPVPGMTAVLNAFQAGPLDAGTAHFAPSNLEVTSLETGNRTGNVIPPAVTARFNIRFNNSHTADSLQEMLRALAQETLAGTGLDFELDFSVSGECFLTEPGALSEVMSTAVEEITGRAPALSTGGGTSDARFIKDYCPVIEFGHINRTIHQRDERVAVEDLDTLTAVYKDFIGRYFRTFAA
jgi:succinyl-diaminopimelate desuccinylase